MIYPWQEKNWRQALQYLKANRLAHAVLISGPQAIGKLEFCLQYAQRLNCTHPTADDRACGECKDCTLFAARTHPDVRLIHKEEHEGQTKEEQIKVDDIRDMNQFMNLTHHQGKYKIICINMAENMNINAANALLKTLEEPPANSILFLISHRMEVLLPTLKSRCQSWIFHLPTEEQALAWLHTQEDDAHWSTLLKMAGGKPLLALALKQSGLGASRADYYQDVAKLMMKKTRITQVSLKHQDKPLGQLLMWQQAWCADLVRCCHVDQPITLENPDIRRSLGDLIGRIDVHSLFGFMDRLTELRRLSNAPLNKRLFIEDMLVRCQAMLRQPSYGQT